MKKIYLAGKVSGDDPQEVRNKFSKKASELEAQGYKVHNPVEHIISQQLDMYVWEVIMRACIIQMLECDEVHMLPCWKQSRGAKMERNLALRLGITVVYHSN